MSAVVRQLNGASAVAPARSAREDGRDSGPPPTVNTGERCVRVTLFLN